MDGLAITGFRRSVLGYSGCRHRARTSLGTQMRAENWALWAVSVPPSVSNIITQVGHIMT